jgi:hypothetical protein
VEKIIIIYVLIINSCVVFAQTETQNILINDTLNIKNVLPQSNINNNLKNLYPAKLPVELDLYNNEKSKNDSINPDLLFVRSVFSNNFGIFRKMEPDYTKLKPFEITEDFGAYIDVEYRFNMQTLKWEIAAKSDIATIIKWIKRIFKKRE